MKDKTKVLNTYGYMFDKLQFICLIGGRVCNPRQQHVAYSRLTTLSRCSSLLLPRVKNPPPQLTRPPIRQTNCSLQFFLPTNFF